MAHPLLPGPDHPCPASGVPAAAVFLAKTLGKTFTTGAQLASHIRPAPPHPQIWLVDPRRVHLPRRQQAPQRAMFLSAFASPRSDPASRAYYQRKRNQGKRPGQAILALTHRHIPTLYAILRNSTLHHPQPAHQLTTTA